MSDRKTSSGGNSDKEWKRSEGLERSLRKREDYSRTKKTEYAGVYDKDGNMIIEKHGDKNSVGFYPWETDKFEGATLTHNHPNNSNFSGADIMSAEKHGLMEVRATTSTGKTYCLRRTNPADAKRGKTGLGVLYDRETERYMREVIRPGYEAERKKMMAQRPVRENAHETYEHFAARHNEWANRYNQLASTWNAKYSAYLASWLRDNSRKYGWSYREEQK